MDKLSKEQRRKNMQAVKATGSKIESVLAKMLFARGHRYRKNDKTVFGRPDLTFVKHKIAIFIDGEFWHGKDWETRKGDHKTNQEFWYKKIERNIERDKEVNIELAKQGWTVLRFWGDEIKKSPIECILKIEETINDKMMNFDEKISISEIEGKKIKIRVLGPESNSDAVLSHYIHNQHLTDIAKFYKKDAIGYTKEILKYKYPEEDITSKVADTALKYRIFETFDVPFPSLDAPKFTFIDLFAGIGGFRLALQNLGGKCVFTSEWDDEAKKTYKANFGDVPFGDITKESTKSYIPDGFDVLCAGFPCQAFSIAGKRGGFEDTRGTLFFDVAEIIRRKQPKAIFLENVKGLLSHNGGKTLATILNVLRNDLNYFVPDPQVVNAKDFGVPQNRERIYIVGFHKDLNIEEFKYPDPIRRSVCFADVKERDVVPTRYYLSTKYIQTLRDHKARHESKGNGFGFEIIPDDGISNAIVVGGMGRERNLVVDKRITDFTPTTNITGEVNREGIRKMTPREWARLQGFPDNFVIPVADASAYKQFGNSVAVPAIQATANAILKRIYMTPDTTDNNTHIKPNTPDNNMTTGNKGEWSETYVFLKLLADGKLNAADANLNSIPNVYYPVIKILRQEKRSRQGKSIKREYLRNGDIKIVDGASGDEILNLPVIEFVNRSKQLLRELKQVQGRSFAFHDIETFLNSIEVKSLAALKTDKADIKVVVHDLNTGLQPTLGFSIKSMIGKNATLFNPNHGTNFIYEISGIERININKINTIKTSPKISNRIVAIKENGFNMRFRKIQSDTLQLNLQLIDSDLPQILSELLLLKYSTPGTASLSQLLPLLTKKNPLNFDLSKGHPFYEYKMKNFLTDSALGMTPESIWTGQYDATGGIIIVKEDGELVCYHIYNRNEFQDYLINNTKLEQASTTRYKFGDLYEENGKAFLKLNLQIRFTN